MTDAIDCTEIRPLLAEYAAGALDARERAFVEDHLGTCAACRTEADSYVDVADELLLLAPSAEPPVGFESAVMARIDRAPRRRNRSRTLALLAAAAVALVGGGVVMGRANPPSSSSSQEQAVSLRTVAGRAVGTAVVHRGNPGWIFATMTYREDWTVKVEMVLRDGTVTPLGSIEVRNGRGSIGALSPVPVDQVRVIRMLDSDGRVLCHAEVHV